MGLVNSSTSLARSIVSQIIESGITDVVLSPGSRNAPLSIAFYQAEVRGLITLHVRIDERSAAFFALGIAKASKRPVAIVCTSGTAVANYYPAVLEAHHSQIPLLVLTADRPERLRLTGANQTTLQANFFSDAVAYADDISECEFDFSRALTSLSRGPVHLNIQFDEPLLPDDESDWLAGISIRLFTQNRAEAPAQFTTSSNRGVVVVGHDRGGFETQDVVDFLQELSWPVISEDPLFYSGSIAHASLFLTSEKNRQELRPETVVVIGRTTLSRSINALIKSADQEVVIDARIESLDIKRTADQLFSVIPTLLITAEADSHWMELWQKKSVQTHSLLNTIPEWCEENIGRALSAVLPARTPLFISSSRPIRDIEGFARPRADIETFANRGLAGIDGNISTALGIASQRSNSVAVVGDLSFLHDMGSLVVTAGINLRVVVINNDGGGIFSTLPQNSVDGFEKIFGTPHGQDPAAIAQAMGVESRTVSTMEDFVSQLSAPIKGLSILVANVPTRAENARILTDFYKAIESI
jgi:2-succinyl-5-enolpyruvyl-6-hydroxy-3-cyclohexene-1-carboxylate synthase